MSFNILHPYRLVIVILCFASSFAGLLGTYVTLLITFMLLSRHSYLGAYLLGSLGFCMLFSWIALTVMSAGWIQDRPVHKRWPILGTMTGAISILFTGFPLNLLSIAPALMLALYLCREVSYVKPGLHKGIVKYSKYTLYIAGLAPFVLALLVFVYSKSKDVFPETAQWLPDVLKPESFIPMSQAKAVVLKQSIDGVSFDVPLNYHFRGYNKKSGGWPNISAESIAGKKRKAYDYITIHVAMPDFAPINERNSADFQVKGHGEIVRASLSHMQHWDYYFANTFPRNEKRPESPDVKGMFHYYDALARHDLFLSHDHATDELTRIICHDQKFFHHLSPSCNVETYYRPPSASGHQEQVQPIFHLEYVFSSQYLSQWRDIDRMLRLTFDQFVSNAGQRKLN
jgi:hypothetical protein